MKISEGGFGGKSLQDICNKGRYMKFIVDINDIVMKELSYFLDMDAQEALHEAIANSLNNELDMDIDEARQSVIVSYSKDGEGSNQ